MTQIGQNPQQKLSLSGIIYKCMMQRLIRLYRALYIKMSIQQQKKGRAKKQTKFQKIFVWRNFVYAVNCPKWRENQ